MNIIFTLSTLSRSKLIEYYIQQEQDGEAFYLGDLSKLDQIHSQWSRLLPQVEPFYAIKSNPTPQLLEYLSKLPNMGFDCASLPELSSALNLEIPPDKIIYANPCKGIKHLKFAKENGVKMMTFDNEAELIKIKDIYPEAELVIRIMVEEFGSTYSFKEKFGASIKDAEKLLKIAKSLSLNIIGVSFHVGTGCKNPNAYYQALKNCRQVFDYAKKELNYDLYLLDIGGGFTDLEIKRSTNESTLFERVTTTIKQGIENFFSEGLNNHTSLRIIAEPGTYFCEKVFTLVTSISSKKRLCNGEQIVSSDENRSHPEKIMYYINQGVYSAFHTVIFGQEVFEPKAVYTKKTLIILDDTLESVYNSTIWGPTCDGGDCVSKETKLPELDIGDWLIFDNFGSYTMATSSNFNGLSQINIYWATN
jgi:ornithine decarboxylase